MHTIKFVPIPVYYSKQLTSPQVFSTFKKEVVSFFIRDIHGFEIICDLNVDIFEQDHSQPSGFSKYKIGDQSIDPIYDNPSRSLPYKIFQKYKNVSKPAIFKVRIYTISKASDQDLDYLFDEYRGCDKKFFSYALDRDFLIGDGDDTGAVTIGKRGKGFYVDIWIRSFLD